MHITSNHMIWHFIADRRSSSAINGMMIFDQQSSMPSLSPHKQAHVRTPSLTLSFTHSFILWFTTHYLTHSSICLNTLSFTQSLNHSPIKYFESLVHLIFTISLYFRLGSDGASLRACPMSWLLCNLRPSSAFHLEHLLIDTFFILIISRDSLCIRSYMSLLTSCKTPFSDVWC